MSPFVAPLCRAEADVLLGWFAAPREQLLRAAVVIAAGSGLFGAALGLWRAPLQALYSGVKMPLVIFGTLAVNALLNGVLAQALGAGLRRDQVLLGCLLSFTTFSLILGAMAPILGFFAVNAPPVGSAGAESFHSAFLLCTVLAFAVAGVVSNLKLHAVLEHICGASTARKVLIAWLLGNLFVGAQLSWTLRPLLGNPALEVEFLRSDALEGTFYEDVAHKLHILIAGDSDA